MPENQERQARSNNEQERPITPDEERLLARLFARREVDPVTDCWYFRGSTTSNGYGHVSYYRGTEYTHRLAAMLFLELDLADGRVVRHICDTPPCFNPEHLRLGTQKDNMRDAVERGRMTGKKLSADRVAVIKYELAHGRTHRSVALEYGVSTTAIGQIARGETWKSVQPQPELLGESEEATRVGR